MMETRTRQVNELESRRKQEERQLEQEAGRDRCLGIWIDLNSYQAPNASGSRLESYEERDELLGTVCESEDSELLLARSYMTWTDWEPAPPRLKLKHWASNGIRSVSLGRRTTCQR